MNHRKVTVATVNKALKDAGYAERVVQAKDYVYFSEGDAVKWYSSTVGGVYRVAQIPDVEWWIGERNRLATITGIGS